MNFLNPLILIPITTGPIFFFAGLLMLIFPPKKINMIYGYRSKNSMKDQQRWNFAQHYAAKKMMIYGSILTLSAVTGIILELNETAGMIAGLGMMVLMVVLLIIDTERAINKKFGKTD